jgi:hypothetical protein
MKHAYACGMLLGMLTASSVAPVLAQSPSASEPDNRRSIVVISDLAPDATSNAKLRAALYEVARERGLEPKIRADVQGAAERSGVMRGGQVTADASELERLRTALGVAVLGRVARDFERGDQMGVTVMVVTAKGVRRESVQVPMHAPERGVSSAFRTLLEGAAPAPPAPRPPEPAVPEHRVAAGALVLPEDETPRNKSGAQLIEEWDRRGGVKPMFAAFVLATGEQRQNVPISGVNPVTGQRDVGAENAFGIGGGVGARLALWYMSLPDPITGQGVFPAFRLGMGRESNFLYVRYPDGYDYGGNYREVSHDSRGFWLVNLPLQVGFHLGLGKFRTQDTWRGAVVGIAYSPTAQFEIDMNQTEGDFRFNELGVELSVDITTIDTAESNETQIRLMIYGLLPKDDDHPGVLTLGLGAAFY